jgi:hypothetical protein
MNLKYNIRRMLWNIRLKILLSVGTDTDECHCFCLFDRDLSAMDKL